MEMNDDECFAMTFPGLVPNGKISTNPDDGFFLKDKPYALLFKNVAGTWNACDYCGQNKCGGCPVPYTDETTIGMVLETIKQESANTFYSQNQKIRGKEFILNIAWHQDINKSLFSFLATAIKFDTNNQVDAESKSADV